MNQSFKTSHSRQLGKLLHDLRKQRALTGSQLGSLVGLSQSRISKIEQGYLPILNRKQADSLLNALDASQKIRQQVQLLLSQLSTDNQTFFNSFRFNYAANVYPQAEEKTTLNQTVMHNMIPALLQIPEYRLAALRIIGIDEKDIQHVMSETFKRQDLLLNTGKRYQFLLVETALYSMPATPLVQITQLDRLERLSLMANCEVGIIPTHVGLPFFENGNFTIWDKTTLICAVGQVDVESHDPEKINNYLKAFDEMYATAYFNYEARDLIRQAAAYFGASKDRSDFV